MKISMYQVDAFTDKLFGGNPAAICLPDSWPAEALMQQVAAENNLAETAFVVKDGDRYGIRWFTPTVEVDLCGHATLAAAHVIFDHLAYTGDELQFFSHRSGLLKVARQGDILTLDFPTDVYEGVDTPQALTDGIGRRPLATYRGKTDLMAVYGTQQEIEAMKPDFTILGTLEGRGVIVTAKGDTADFVSRFFAPQSGIDEDPVTGSAHTTLTPYWAGELGRSSLSAIQLSPRKGYLQCRHLGERVAISGHAVTYLEGTISI